MKFTLFTAATAALSFASQVAATPVAVADVKLVERQEETYICGPRNPDTWGKLVTPASGSTITQVRGSYDPISFEIIYCSTDYFKTRSLGLTIGLARPENALSYGEILALDYKPSNEPGVAQGGYYGYKFNVSLYPVSGAWRSGQYVLSAAEHSTGYTNPYNYHIQTANLNFVIVDPPAA